MPTVPSSENLLRYNIQDTYNHYKQNNFSPDNAFGS